MDPWGVTTNYGPPRLYWIVTSPQRAEKQVAYWEQQLDDTVIRAPFNGIVTAKNAQPGEMISPISAGGGFTRTGIGTIVDMGSLEIEIDVNESYINRVTPGQPVEATLDAYPDWKIPSKVIAIIPTADRQKSTVKVRVSFDQAEYTADVVGTGTLRLLEAVRDSVQDTGKSVKVYQAGSSEMFGAAKPPQNEDTVFYPR